MTSTELITAEDIANELAANELASQPIIPEIADEPESAAVVPFNNYIGIASAPFSPEAADILMQPIPDTDIEIRPDGLIYLPEIKYRRILNHAFSPGAWSMLPMDITVASADNMLYYRGALFVHGRFVSEAIGEQQYFASNDRMSYATAAEAAKSNCLMRCCKDLGIASELWDPSFVRKWIDEHATAVWCANIGSGGDRGKKRKMWRKRSAPAIDLYPWKEEGPADSDYRGADIAAPQPRTEQATKAAPAAQAASNGSSGSVISFRQVKRFQAIAGQHGWTPDETVKLLKHYGYASADTITRSDYDKICTALENPELLAEIRGRR